MARPSDLLRRFRLMAVPGRAGIAGVPADHAALLREELAPVFAALHGSLQRADDVATRAKAEADDRREKGIVEARRVLDQARDAQPAARARSAATEKVRANSSAEEIGDDARHEIERIERAKAVRMAAIVDELVGRVLATGASSETYP